MPDQLRLARTKEKKAPANFKQQIYRRPPEKRNPNRSSYSMPAAAPPEALHMVTLEIQLPNWGII